MNAEFGQRADQSGLETAEVVDHAHAPAAQVDDPVSHQLTRPVVGDVAAALSRYDFDASRPDDRHIDGQIRLRVASSQREHRAMFG